MRAEFRVWGVILWVVALVSFSVAFIASYPAYIHRQAAEENLEAHDLYYGDGEYVRPEEHLRRQGL